jgi:hypothetical protein
MIRLLIFPLFASALTAIAADVNTIPEIEAGRTAYHQALAKIRAERDQQTAGSKQTYTKRVQDLQKKLAEEGDTKGADAAQEEADRLARGVEPTNEERRKMIGLLLALRVAYEKDRGPVYIAAAKREAQAHAAWDTGLGQLEAHLTKLRQLNKVAVVKAERARVDAAKAEAIAAANPPPIDGAPTTPPPSPGAASGQTLDAGLAEKIKAAIAQKKTSMTATSGTRRGSSNVPDDGALLIGFEVSEFGWRGKSVKALDPIFLTNQGVFRGEMRGKHSKERTVVQAPAGYAVGALNVYSHDRIGGMQIIFMKIDSATGKLDPQSKYESKWFGTKGEGDPKQLGGDGRLVIGVHGATGADADTIGLVQMQ